MNHDAAASTNALPAVAERVAEFLPWYSSVHRGAGYKSQLATAAYEDAREGIRRFAGRSDRDDVANICRNTTEAINHLAYRLPLAPGDVVLTTVSSITRICCRGAVSRRVALSSATPVGPSGSRRSARRWMPSRGRGCWR